MLKKLSNVKGFTLIELLVVIAIIGILAAVVLIAIDPAERINEANDSGVKSRVSQVQAAVESCFTQKATGYYDACLTQSALRSGGFLKGSSADLPGVLINPATGTSIANVAVYGELKAKSVSCPTGQTGTKYFSYHSATGQAAIACGTAGSNP